MKIALTGSSGNMGYEVLQHLLTIKELEKIKLLILPKDPDFKRVKKVIKNHKNITEIIIGNIKDYDICQKMVSDVDYVINLAGVIPPLSDKDPIKSYECNELGTINICKAIEAIKEHQPKLIDTTSVALYGNRNYLHPFGRVGDPLLVSPFDAYAAHKLRAEYYLLESNIDNWVVLRQTAMIYHRLLKQNMKDGLMFHTNYNCFLEWVTSHDSAILIKNIIIKDQTEDLSKIFWKKVFNIGSLKENLVTGYETINEGFKIIGGTVKDFFLPNDNITRNFHGLWYYDGYKLNDLFNYQTQTLSNYWKEIGKKYWYFKLGRLLPKSLIAKIAVKRLYNNYNAPKYWYKVKDEARMHAFFKGVEEFEKLPNDKKGWPYYNLIVENKNELGMDIDYEDLKEINKAKLIDLGYNDNLKDEEITIADLRQVATLHGGKLLSEEYHNDIYQKLQWENQDGITFTASAYTVLRAGHWYNPIYTGNIWDFNRLSKKDKIFAAAWYDSHDENENKVYYFDKDYKACYKDS